MVSILIPVFNYDVTLLVTTLSEAVAVSDLFIEIIIGSDGSDKQFVESYKAAEKLDNVRLIISNENIGRAAIRNRLADEARGDSLLYIDADALIEGNAIDWLNRWGDYINSENVVCGGTGYPSLPPGDPDKYLRWHYGFNHEQRSARERSKDPYASFSGFNFLINKDLFSKIKFNEKLRKYGHEDTLLGFRLRLAGIGIIHIENPLVHDGVETNREFLIKTREGISNLSLLYDSVDDRRLFRSTVRLLRVYHRLRLFWLDRLVNMLFARYKRRLEIILQRKKCSLKVFSFYKLGLLCHLRLEKS